jgi:sugar transferase (PEP-CTERM/EpsH1 system associated)
VDADFFCPDPKTGGAYDNDTVSFIGRMDYYPNQECMMRFCKEVWPQLRRERGTMKLLIVGADPSPQIKALGSLPGVTVTGSVPDVRPYIRGSALMVAPLAIARGTQNKILEAMAMGVPVVTSSAAAGGVDAEADKHLLVADTAEQITTAILRIATDRDERGRLAKAGRERMLSHHAWPRSMQRLDGIIERCVRDFAQAHSSKVQTPA